MSSLKPRNLDRMNLVQRISASLTRVKRDRDIYRATCAVQGAKLARIADAIGEAQGSDWIGAPNLCSQLDAAQALDVIRLILCEKGSNRGG